MANVLDDDHFSDPDHRKIQSYESNITTTSKALQTDIRHNEIEKETMENDKKQVLRPTGTTAPTITHDPRTPSLMEATNHLIQALHTNDKMKAGKRAGTDDAGIHDYNQTKATK